MTGSPPHGYRLRDEVAPNDVDAVAALVRATGFFRPDEVDVATELVEDRLEHGDRSSYHFLLLDDEGGRLTGYACFGPIACTVASYDLYWIAVLPSLQGRGLGRFLLAESEHRIAALGGRRVYVETSSQSSYAATRSFYLRCGYRQEAELCDFYAPGDGKIIYCRLLTGAGSMR